MTQCQIDLVREATKCDYEHLDTNLLKREAVFTIDDETKVIIKKTGRRLQQKTFIHIVVKGKKIKINRDVWLKLCNLKESIVFLHSFIEDH